MSEPMPEFGEPRVSTTPIADAVDDVMTDYGPDPAQSGESKESPLRRGGRRNGTKTLPKVPLGNNKKPRSGVRALTEKDREKIENLYIMAGMGVMPIKPKTGAAFAQAAEQCAEAWYELAKENDGVRRVILVLIEGGAWGKVFAAHSPIILTLLPNDVWEKVRERLGDAITLKAPDFPPTDNEES